ncbi:flagellar assembly peptidoglycan hydrolase FlgJ [Nitrosomonas ureae]|nr:flagellar assembly peptidoglycan hydrolase FlgJ [Nitrosomonas ureae]
MMISADISSKLAIDAKSIDDLHLMAKRDPQQALHKAAQQFEALFMNMLLKSMREATPKDGMFDSQQTQFFTQMYDQQLAQHLSTKGIGIANILVKQLGRADGPIEPQTSISQADAILSSISAVNPPSPLKNGHPGDISGQLWPSVQNSKKTEKMTSSNEVFITPIQIESQLTKSLNRSTDFINMLMPHAKTASQSTGIPSHFMLAQAALESGWGKHEIRRADNSPSYNLFGIKAGPSWKGDTVEKVTTEYINGIPQKIVDKFRAYNSYAEGFNDYARLLLDNPRYAKVLESSDFAAFATGLQRAGYATDPKYAEKLIRIINSEAMQNREFI